MTTQRSLSSNTELVSFGVIHDNMPEDPTIRLLTHCRRPRSGEFAHLRADELLPLRHVPGWSTRHSDVDVHPVLCRFPLRHPEKSDRRALAVRVDNRRTVREVIARLVHIPERQSPERGKPTRIDCVATERPMSSHAQKAIETRSPGLV